MKPKSNETMLWPVKKTFGHMRLLLGNNLKQQRLSLGAQSQSFVGSRGGQTYYFGNAICLVLIHRFSDEAEEQRNDVVACEEDLWAHETAVGNDFKQQRLSLGTQSHPLVGSLGGRTYYFVNASYSKDLITRFGVLRRSRSIYPD